MKKKQVTILLGGLVSVHAYAGFMVVDIPKTQPAPAAAVKAGDAFILSGYDRVLYKGSAQDIRVVRGLGRNVSITLALKQILQSSDWHGYAKPGVNKSAKVTWHGGKPWVEVLNDMLAQTSQMAEVDWDAKTITLLPETEGKHLVARKAAAPVLAKAPVPAPKPAWEMAPQDGTLKVVLNKWARMAGWQVSWEVLDNQGHAADYPIQMYAKIGGSFENAVAQVMDSLSNTTTPAKAIFYNGNRVLRVVAAGENK